MDQVEELFKRLNNFPSLDILPTDKRVNAVKSRSVYSFVSRKVIGDVICFVISVIYPSVKDFLIMQ